MEYRIEKMDAIQIICKRTMVAEPEEITATKDISTFWDKCAADGTTQRIIGYFPDKPQLKGLLGVCFSSEIKDGLFPYGIGVEYDGQNVTDDDLEVVEIPAKTYAVFTCRGKMPESFQKTYRKIVTEFFPQNKEYAYGCGAELEVYPSEDIESPDYTCEIWIAVKKK